MTLFLIPSIIALLIILAIYLNDINPWAGIPISRRVKEAAFLVLVFVVLNLVFFVLDGGAK